MPHRFLPVARIAAAAALFAAAPVAPAAQTVVQYGAEFLAGGIGFRDIPAMIEQVLSEVPARTIAGLEDVLEADRRARERASVRLLSRKSQSRVRQAAGS